MKNLRPHIGLLGRTNVGKSSLINSLADQEIAIVSDQAGTTTDPVLKTIEFCDIGPLVFVDTAGLDDESELGKKRIQKTLSWLPQLDLAIILLSDNKILKEDLELLKKIKAFNIPFFFIHNQEDKSSLKEDFKARLEKEHESSLISFSCSKKGDLAQKEEVIKAIKKYLPPNAFQKKTILGDLIAEGDLVLMVAPVDEETPQGRIILPQVMCIRDCLDHNAVAIVLKDHELESFLQKYPSLKPKLVLTDSQVFKKVSSLVPPEYPLTSFSILFSRMKGDFERMIEGTRAISNLKDHDKVLILESCSHHVQGDDIGRVKLPKWIRDFTKKELKFEVLAGNTPISQKLLEETALVVQCGGCMLTRTQVLARISPFTLRKIPVTNYGMCISYCTGVFDRVISPLINTQDLLRKN